MLSAGDARPSPGSLSACAGPVARTRRRRSNAGRSAMGLCADSQWRAKSAQPADGRFGSADRHQSWGGLRHVNHVTEGPDIEWASAALDGCVCEACGHVGANHAPPMRWRLAWTLGATIQSDLSSDAGPRRLMPAPGNRVPPAGRCPRCEPASRCERLSRSAAFRRWR